MFHSSSCKRIDSLGLIYYEKEEIFYIKDSKNISSLYVTSRNEDLVDDKLSLTVYDQRNVPIIKIKAVLSELIGKPVVHDVNKIFAKTEYVFVYINVGTDNIDKILVNSFNIIPQ